MSVSSKLDYLYSKGFVVVVVCLVLFLNNVNSVTELDLTTTYSI